MFTIYNSISNLGALNIGSVVIVILIDQFACRTITGVFLLLTVQIISYVQQNSQDNYIQNTNEAKNNFKLKIFDYLLVRNLC